VLWILFCVLFSLNTVINLKMGPVYWNLDTVWKAELDQRMTWLEEIGIPKYGMKAKDYDWHRRMFFKSHVEVVISILGLFYHIIFPIIVILVTSLYLNRLFFRGEITLYLVRPISPGGLFWGRFVGLYTVFAVMSLLTHVLFLVGSIGPEWAEVLPLFVYHFQTQLTILVPVLGITFLMTPLTCRLFRGAGPFITSYIFVFISYVVPAKSAFRAGLFPYSAVSHDPLSHKILGSFTNIFLLPVPRVFAAQSGFKELTHSYSQWGQVHDFGLLTQHHQGFWLWTFGSGLLVIMLAFWLWSRKEYS